MNVVCAQFGVASRGKPDTVSGNKDLRISENVYRVMDVLGADGQDSTCSGVEARIIHGA